MASNHQPNFIRQERILVSSAIPSATLDLFALPRRPAPTNSSSQRVRILETLLKKSLQDQVEVVNNTCYFLNEPPKKLAGGFEERLGFTQALNLSSGRSTLNIQTKLTTFYPDIALLDFIHIQIGSKRIPNENEFKKLNRILKNCLVVTRQSNWKQAYEIDQFDQRRPTEITIESGETLVEYYKNAKNITLNQTNYPCIQVYLPSIIQITN
ncbi:unnamed protein product [Rotaria sp. Silwood2]|nr:unnamed protein product [Rotaria sp. Silwood2]